MKSSHVELEPGAVAALNVRAASAQTISFSTVVAATAVSEATACGRKRPGHLTFASSNAAKPALDAHSCRAQILAAAPFNVV